MNIIRINQGSEQLLVERFKQGEYKVAYNSLVTKLNHAGIEDVEVCFNVGTTRDGSVLSVDNPVPEVTLGNVTITPDTIYAGNVHDIKAAFEQVNVVVRPNTSVVSK